MVSTPAHLPVAPEAAGSSPVAPANSLNRPRTCLSQRQRPNYFGFSLIHRILESYRQADLSVQTGAGERIGDLPLVAESR